MRYEIMSSKSAFFLILYEFCWRCRLFSYNALQISAFFLSETYLTIPRASIKGAGAPSFQCHSRSSCLANTATEGSTVLIYIIIVSSFKARCRGNVRRATHRIWLSGSTLLQTVSFTSGIKLKSDRFSTGINLKSDSFYNKDKNEWWYILQQG